VPSRSIPVRPALNSCHAVASGLVRLGDEGPGWLRRSVRYSTGTGRVCLDGSTLCTYAQQS